jgi:nucleoside phosphorylase
MAYTVGWICATATEFVAAEVFLDENYGRPEHVHSHDVHDYTLGKIGNYNVAIAVVPKDSYASSSAAGIARNIIHSFPNIRIVVMVGVGGGAPTHKHDIRLGDIVVSSTRDSAVQYDFSKTIQDQNLYVHRFLDQPPRVLQLAVSRLKADYRINGHQITETINRILEANPRLRRKWGRPSLEKDRLYHSTVQHPLNNEEDCAVVCGNENLRQRDDRAEDEDNPSIHYGLIASANQLMNNALLRDKLAEDNNVLCFEMEASGLMTHFPCLVIRGICDYSDTHKNSEWEGYAAMVAAAYAKDVLRRIPPDKTEAEETISDLVSYG